MKRLDDYDRAALAQKKAVADVYVALWKDPRYVRMNDRKSEALRAWNRADAFAKSVGAVAVANAVRRADRCMLACRLYEDRALRAAGLAFATPLANDGE